MTHYANTYNSLMFESITETPERQKELKTNALMQAWETRNFEINLYWKRAAYFWAFWKR